MICADCREKSWWSWHSHCRCFEGRIYILCTCLSCPHLLQQTDRPVIMNNTLLDQLWGKGWFWLANKARFEGDLIHVSRPVSGLQDFPTEFSVQVPSIPSLTRRCVRAPGSGSRTIPMGMKMVLARSPEVGFSPCILCLFSISQSKAVWVSFTIQTNWKLPSADTCMRLLVLFRFQVAFLLHLATTQIVQMGLLRAETFTNILAQGTKQKAAFRVRVLRVLRVSPISWSTLPRARARGELQPHGMSRIRWE